MAVTKIHPIKSTLKKSLDYIENPDKTDEKLFVSSYGCSYETADIEFQIKYPYVITTHIDKGHLHNHIIFCAVDMAHQRKYISNRQSYAFIRRTSDRLCRVFPIRCSAGGSGWPSCRWTQPCVPRSPKAGTRSNAAPSAGQRLRPTPTGPNTARIARCRCAGRKRQNASGKDTSCLRI